MALSDRLEKDKNWHYYYDTLGNLKLKSPYPLHGKEPSKKWQPGCWSYEWYASGMLKSVQKPGGTVVSFEYDALGRRIAKICKDTITRYVWDGNVLLHEWRYALSERPVIQVRELGELFYDKAEPIENVVTWVYEQGSFTLIAKLVNEERYSIVSDYIGRPVQVYDSKGELVWSTDYDIYGRLRNQKGEKQLIPFRQPGQYEDEELGGLYFNRFRYYDSQAGLYISKDPIGLLGGLGLYAYVKDANWWVDIFGLHEAIAILNGETVTTPKGGYSWYSTIGSSKAPFNGFGAAGHSEAKILEHLEKTKGGSLKGSKLEIISMGQMTKGGKGQLSTLPPCDRCLKGLEAFAKKHEMDISYKWDEGEVEFKGCK